MAFENSEDVNLRFENPVDDSVVTKQHLSHVVAPELRDPSPSARVTRSIPRARAEACNPATRHSWLVASDVATDLQQVGTSALRPSKLHDDVSSSSFNSRSKASSSTSRPVSESSRPDDGLHETLSLLEAIEILGSDDDGCRLAILSDDERAPPFFQLPKKL